MHIKNNYDSKHVFTIQFNQKEIILIGTAHISKESVDLVRKVLSGENPDTVCLEIDAKRFNILTKKEKWESLNLLQVIKNKQLVNLFFNLMLSSYQKKLGSQTGVLPGAEMLEAFTVAEKLGITVSFCDRDARTTLKRAWRKTSFLKKFFLLGNMLGLLFDNSKIDEPSLEKLKNSDFITEMMRELGAALPGVKSVLIDERDNYMAFKIASQKGKKIAAVVGAGHLEGIKRIFEHNILEKDVSQFEKIPPSGISGKFLAWSLPALIITALIGIGYKSGFDSAKYNMIYWIIANGSFCMLGAILALGHPFTIVAAFVAAPLTSLTPVIGAGYVTAFVQVLARPPSVSDIQNIGKHIFQFKKWWKNGALKVFLCFFLPGFGSMVGTWVGGYEIIKNFLSK